MSVQSPFEPTPAADAPEREALRAAAELLGRLLLCELEPADLERLRAPEVRGALAEVGATLPEPNDESAWLEARGADYHDLFLRPDAGPLVQSLWTQGRYEGDSTVRVRQLAEAAGMTFDRERARGAAVDHLGSLLLLWAATDGGHAQPVADEVCAQHLAWARAPVGRLAGGDGFYAAVARGVGLLLEALVPGC